MNVFKELDKPIVFKIPEVKDSVSKSKPTPKFSKNIDYPSFSLGFQHYIHANKDKFDILDEFVNKKKVYMVLNKLNKDIDEYDDDLNSYAKKQFGLDVDQDFLVYWELLTCFDLFGKSVYIAVGKKSIELSVKHLAKILDTKMDVSIKPTKSDLVLVSYEGGEYDYRNTIEQDSFGYLISEIEKALNNLNKDGSLVVKFNEMYTRTTNKLIYSIAEHFSESYFYKPLTDPQSESDRFVIFSKLKKSSEGLVKALQSINTCPKGSYIVDFFEDFILPTEYVSTVRKFNTDIANRQLIDVNKIVEFIKSENYYGETYQTYRDRQISYTKKWIERYLQDLKKNRKEIIESIKELAKLYNERAEKIDSQLS